MGVVQLLNDNRTWNQTVYVDGKLIATLESYDGPLYNGGWGTGIECNDNCVGLECTQIYYNTTIKLSSADPNFSSTLGKGADVAATDLTTADGGVTWTVERIELPPMVKGSGSSSSSAVTMESTVGQSSTAGGAHATPTVTAPSGDLAASPSASGSSASSCFFRVHLLGVPACQVKAH